MDIFKPELAVTTFEFGAKPDWTRFEPTQQPLVPNRTARCGAWALNRTMVGARVRLREKLS